MKCGLFAALFAALLIVLSGGYSASAATDYGVKVTDKLMVYRDNTTCEAKNISNSYYSIITNIDYYTNIGQMSSDYAQTLIDKYNRTLNRGGDWLIVNDTYTSDYGNRQTVEITFNDADTYIEWNPELASVPTMGPWRGLTTIKIEMLPNCNDYKITDVVGGGLVAQSYDPFTRKVFLANVKNMNYPADYNGGEIPAEIDEEKPTIRPEFSYMVTDKDIQARDHKKDLPEFEPDEGYTFNGYEVEWSLFKNSELIDHQILLQEKEYKYKVKDYGDYKLEARYLVQQCYRYAGYPETPDYCFYVDLGTEFKDIDFTSTAVNLKIDGSSSSGNTLLLECDVAGVCSPPKKTPASLFFNGLDNLNTFGLTQFFTAPITFLATLPAKAENCSPISFPLLGRTIEIECLKPRYYQWSATVMNIYTTLLVAGTGYLIAFNVFRHIKDVNTPDKDKIEVARL